jgi:hypothetical protein
MSDPKGNETPAEVDRLADRVFDAVEAAISEECFDAISDDSVQKLMTAAVKLFHRKSIGERRVLLPVISEQALTATEAVNSACELIRAVDLNPFDLALWYSRPRLVQKAED